MQKRHYYMLNRTFRFNFEKFQVNLAEILVFTGLFLWTVQIYFDDSGYYDLTGELPLKLILPGRRFYHGHFKNEQ